MMEEGIAKYGKDAYGPRGRIIDTYSPFQVETKFINEFVLQDEWRLRTVLTQDEKIMTLETICDQSIAPVDGEMAIVFVNWDNRDGQMATFDSECPNRA